MLLYIKVWKVEFRYFDFYLGKRFGRCIVKQDDIKCNGNEAQSDYVKINPTVRFPVLEKNLIIKTKKKHEE